jgi:hypothetical protein
MTEFTHDELVKRGELWLLKEIGCSFCLSEFSTIAGETPDNIGWKWGRSILIECKATRADFLSDKRKAFRKNPLLGMGTYRLYLCNPGIIKLEELPDKWGLLYCYEKSIKRIKAPGGNEFHGFPSFEPNTKNEMLMLCSVIRRVHLRGDLEKIYRQDGILC